MYPALATLDPADWGTGLSPANARASWRAAVADLDETALSVPIAGRAPRRVLVICSGNVFTAPLPWLAHLAARGVPVILKPATGQELAGQQMAAVFPNVEVREWRGGDLVAEAAAMAEVDAVIGFGGSEAMAAIGARVPPGVVWLPFGPRFGVGVVDTLSAAAAEDLAPYDSRGCMSPAAYFARHHDLVAAANAMRALEERLPRGELEPAEAAGIRGRIILARAVGKKIVGAGWTVLELPIAQFNPIALPRVLVIHPFTDVEEVRAALAPWRDRLGTVAFDLPGLYLGAPRMCAPGRMQRPTCGRFHDGVDVLGALWGQSALRPDGSAGFAR